MRWVVDGSVAVAYLLGEGTAVEREALLGDVHGPSLIDVEVTGILRGLMRAGKLGPAAAEAARRDLPRLGIHRHTDASLLNRAWHVRERCGVCDGLYVGLAEALEATLLTRDARLARVAAAHVDVRASG